MTMLLFLLQGHNKFMCVRWPQVAIVSAPERFRAAIQGLVYLNARPAERFCQGEHLLLVAIKGCHLRLLSARPARSTGGPMRARGGWIPHRPYIRLEGPHVHTR